MSFEMHFLFVFVQFAHWRQPTVILRINVVCNVTYATRLQLNSIQYTIRCVVVALRFDTSTTMTFDRQPHIEYDSQSNVNRRKSKHEGRVGGRNTAKCLLNLQQQQQQQCQFNVTHCVKTQRLETSFSRTDRQTDGQLCILIGVHKKINGNLVWLRQAHVWTDMCICILLNKIYA